MKHMIIKKRIEPYNLIEGVKKYYTVEDYTFKGVDKFSILETFISKLNEIQKTSVAFGLYMKNVNKFYLAYSDENINNLEDSLDKKVINNILEISDNQEDIICTDSRDEALSSIDMGKAEASIIIS